MSLHPSSCCCKHCAKYPSIGNFRNDLCIQCSEYNRKFLRHKRCEYYIDKTKTICFETCTTCARVIFKNCEVDYTKTFHMCSCAFCKTGISNIKSIVCARCQAITSMKKVQVVNVFENRVMYFCCWKCDACFNMKIESTYETRTSPRGKHNGPQIFEARLYHPT